MATVNLQSMRVEELIPLFCAGRSEHISSAAFEKAAITVAPLAGRSLTADRPLHCIASPRGVGRRKPLNVPRPLHGSSCGILKAIEASAAAGLHGCVCLDERADGLAADVLHR
jgi:hypothetical protein